MKPGKQIIIPPGGIATCTIEMTVHALGPFEGQFDLFLEGKGIQTASVIVKGIGIAPGGSKYGSPST